MVLLLERLGLTLKSSSKMENHHQYSQPSQPLMASLQAFRSHVSNHLNQLSLNSQPKSDFLSLTYIQQCLDLISIVNKGFAKLVMDIDYPMSKWDVPFIDEYLNHSLDLLDLLNSLSSSISHLSQARLSLSHALGLVEKSPSLAIQHLKPIMSKSFSKDLKQESKEESKERSDYGKVWVVQQALMVMKSICFWVFGVLFSGQSTETVSPHVKVKLRTSESPRTESHTLSLPFFSGLSDNTQPCLEIKKTASRVVDSSFHSEWTMEKRGLLKEVTEVNDAVACLVSAMVTKKGVDSASKELQRRLEVFDKLMEGVEKCSNRLFSEVLAARNELLDSLRHQKW